MAYTTVNKSTDYFNTLLWQGNGNNARALTGVGFQPDFTWIKDRTDTESHCLTDAVRGATKSLRSNGDNAEATDTDALQSFNSDGFTLGDQGQVNKSNGDYYVGWNWKANGAGSANTDGSTNSTVSVNTTAGFSIVKYTGSGANATIGHGLGVAPAMIIVKNLTEAGYDWVVYHQSLGNGSYIRLNLTSDKSNGSVWQSTTPTSSVFSVVSNSSDVNKNGNSFIAYCFAEKQGYSKFGSYTGNDNSTFVYTGFKPKFLMLKNRSESNGWLMLDSSRTAQNPMGAYIYANTDGAEGTVTYIDFLSNGFRLVSTNSVAVNKDGNTFIYYAVAEEPFVANVGESIPATAR